jgi:diguanylate cyclase (GGDEF)-like protein/PAS domain S-box-containing protein
MQEGLMAEEKWTSLLGWAKDVVDDFSLLRILLEKSRLGVVVVDKNFRAIIANKQFADMLGYSMEEILQMHVWDWDANFKKDHFMTSNGTPVMEPVKDSLETIHRRKDGTLINVFISSDLEVINGEPYGFSLCKDVTEQVRTENALKRSENLFRNFVENAHELMFVVDNEYRITYFSPNVKRLYDEEAEKFIGKSCLEFVFEQDYPRVKSAFRQVFNKEKGYMVIDYRLKGCGNLNWVSGSLTLSKDEQDQPIIIGVVRDIEEHKRNEEKLQFLSYHDPVTGLFNRVYLNEIMNRLQRRRYYPVTIFSIDIDHLKHINDTYGHHEGDNAIKACSNLIKTIFRKKDIITRIGGDEFVVVLPCTDEKTAQKIEERINNLMRQQIPGDKIGPVDFSYGFSTAEDPAVPLLEIYKEADTRLIRMKELKHKPG